MWLSSDCCHSRHWPWLHNVNHNCKALLAWPVNIAIDRAHGHRACIFVSAAEHMFNQTTPKYCAILDMTTPVGTKLPAGCEGY